MPPKKKAGKGKGKGKKKKGKKDGMKQHAGQTSQHKVYHGLYFLQAMMNWVLMICTSAPCKRWTHLKNDLVSG